MPTEIGGYSHSSMARVLEECVRMGIEQVRAGGVLVLLAYAFGGEDDR